MREIGGYFELELNHGKEYHDNAIKLNLGRTAFEYVLRAKGVQKVFLPFYSCDVLLEPIIKLGIEYYYYNIDDNLIPILNLESLTDFDSILYINYFGIQDDYISFLSKQVKNLIIDNSQSFFSLPLLGVDTFYSPRKFFGVPDGGYLYTSSILFDDLCKDDSSSRFMHLIGRIEHGPQLFYPHFKNNENLQKGQSLMTMSRITQLLMGNIDYLRISSKRIKNFQFLHEHLGSSNLLKINYKSKAVPMVYPYLTNRKNLRHCLIKEGIYAAQYWPHLDGLTVAGTMEHQLLNYLIPLPIDQRYSEDDMSYIVNKIRSCD